jgi:hypothetical protein
MIVKSFLNIVKRKDDGMYLYSLDYILCVVLILWRAKYLVTIRHFSKVYKMNSKELLVLVDKFHLEKII